MPIIRPSSELQRNIGSIYELCHSTQEPVYITRNGKADLVVMDADAFERHDTLQKTIYERDKRIQESILKGWEQAQRGELIPLEEVRKERDGA